MFTPIAVSKGKHNFPVVDMPTFPGILSSSSPCEIIIRTKTISFQVTNDEGEMFTSIMVKDPTSLDSSSIAQILSVLTTSTKGTNGELGQTESPSPATPF